MTTRHRLLTLALALALGATMVANAASIPTDRSAVEHALSRLTFGARPGDVERVQQLGLAEWVDAQLARPRASDTDLARRLPATPERPAQFDSVRDARRYGRDAVEALAAAKLMRAVYSERQLEEVLVDFWFNHFNVFAGKGRVGLLLTEYEEQAIRPHVFGRFRDLLGATAKSPAMLFYLDNWLSSDPAAADRFAQTRRVRARRTAVGNAPPPARRRGLNENYARELLELHTLGVDGGYTQRDIVDTARAFTGWTIDPLGAGAMSGMRATAAGTARGDEGFRFARALHDPGEKTVLGHRLQSGGGIEDGERVLDILAAHPSTARHIATKLARRFVSDTPPEPLVARTAARFLETKGDLREVVRTVITSPEFFSAEARRAKVKTPLEFVVSALRATNSDIQNARPALRALQQLGMMPYMAQPPTGYDDTADAWINAGALVTRMNIARQLAGPQDAVVIGGPDFQWR